MSSFTMPSLSFLTLLAQHFSSSLTERSLEFLSPLILILLFPTTLLPASFLGLGITLASVFGSGRVGKWVDMGRPRLRVARKGVVGQKIGQVGVYLGLLGLFYVGGIERLDLNLSESSSGITIPARIIRSLCSHLTKFSYADLDPPTAVITSTRGTGIAFPQALLLLWIVLSCMVGRLATTGITLAVEREWILIISSSSPSPTSLDDIPSSLLPNDSHTPSPFPLSLTTLTTSVRRTYLLTRLLSPFLVTSLISLASPSAPTSSSSPASSSSSTVSSTGFDSEAYVTVLWGMMFTTILMGMGEWIGVGMIWRGWKELELFESREQEERVNGGGGDDGDGEQVVDGGYRMIPITADEEDLSTFDGSWNRHTGERSTSSMPGNAMRAGRGTETDGRGSWMRRMRLVDVWEGVRESWDDLREFSSLPVFLSSLSISSLYLTTLSFDGILLSYLISTQHLSPTMIALTSGLCVITGLLGTVVMPLGERYIGLIRTGAWSIWSEAICLLLVLFSLSLSVNKFTPLSGTIFFFAVAMSRTGLYAFDLVQTNEIQLALKENGKRGRFQAMQMGMQSGVELGKYGLVVILNRPEQFPYTAIISTIAVFIGAMLYTRYVYKVRGHVLHWSKLWGEARQA